VGPQASPASPASDRIKDRGEPERTANPYISFERHGFSRDAAPLPPIFKVLFMRTLQAIPRKVFRQLDLHCKINCLFSGLYVDRLQSIEPKGVIRKVLSTKGLAANPPPWLKARRPIERARRAHEYVKEHLRRCGRRLSPSHISVWTLGPTRQLNLRSPCRIDVKLILRNEGNHHSLNGNPCKSHAHGIGQSSLVGTVRRGLMMRDG